MPNTVDKNKLNVKKLGATFDRFNGQCLDDTTVWNSYDDLVKYAYGNKAYAGQLVTLVTTGEDGSTPRNECFIITAKPQGEHIIKEIVDKTTGKTKDVGYDVYLQSVAGTVSDTALDNAVSGKLSGKLDKYIETEGEIVAYVAHDGEQNVMPIATAPYSLVAYDHKGGIPITNVNAYGYLKAMTPCMFDNNYMVELRWLTGTKARNCFYIHGIRWNAPSTYLLSDDKTTVFCNGSPVDLLRSMPARYVTGSFDYVEDYTFDPVWLDVHTLSNGTLSDKRRCFAWVSVRGIDANNLELLDVRVTVFDGGEFVEHHVTGRPSNDMNTKVSIRYTAVLARDPYVDAYSTDT